MVKIEVRLLIKGPLRRGRTQTRMPGIWRVSVIRWSREGSRPAIIERTLACRRRQAVVICKEDMEVAVSSLSLSLYICLSCLPLLQNRGISHCQIHQTTSSYPITPWPCSSPSSLTHKFLSIVLLRVELVMESNLSLKRTSGNLEEEEWVLDLQRRSPS